MFSYLHHMGDFNKATRHLSRVERSIYRDMIELYYETEKPLPHDISSICRLILAVNKEEKAAVIQLLAEFFHISDNGYVQFRCEHEIEKFSGYISGKAKAGKASAERRKAKRAEMLGRMATDVEQTLNACSTDVELRTNTEATESQLTSKPVNQLTSKPETVVSATPLVIPSEVTKVPVEEIVNLFNKILPELPQVQKISDSRRRSVRHRWIQNDELQSLESWDRFFKYIRTSDWLMGRIKPFPGMGFDWVFNPNNFIKIYEGNYHGGQQ